MHTQIPTSRKTRQRFILEAFLNVVELIQLHLFISFKMLTFLCCQTPCTPGSFNRDLSHVLESQERELENRRTSMMTMEILLNELNAERAAKNEEIQRLKVGLFVLVKWIPIAALRLPNKIQFFSPSTLKPDYSFGVWPVTNHMDTWLIIVWEDISSFQIKLQDMYRKKCCCLSQWYVTDCMLHYDIVATAIVALVSNVVQLEHSHI